MDIKMMDDNLVAFNNPMYSDTRGFGFANNLEFTNPLYRGIGNNSNGVYDEQSSSLGGGRIYDLGGMTGEYQSIGPNGEILSVPMESEDHIDSAYMFVGHESPYISGAHHKMGDAEGNVFSVPLDGESDTATYAVPSSEGGYLELAALRSHSSAPGAAGNAGNANDGGYLQVKQQRSGEYATVNSATTFAVPNENGEYMGIMSRDEYSKLRGEQSSHSPSTKGPGYDHLRSRPLEMGEIHSDTAGDA